MPQSSQQPITVRMPRAEHHDDPTGIGEARPRISWRIDTRIPGWQQAAYEIEANDPGAGRRTTTGRVDSSESVLVPWGQPALGSRAQRRVRVRVWGAGDDSPSEWSPVLRLETGLLAPEDWTAAFITTLGTDTSPDEPPPLMRREFSLPRQRRIVSARLHATALGLYELELNGERVADHAPAPGWTSYRSRLRYQTLDVTEALRPGRNALGAWLADGWYRGRLGFGGGTRAIYGEEIALLAQLEIRYDDGTTDTVGTDRDWRSATGPIRRTGLYDGEHHDARLALPGWSEPEFDDSGWGPVRILERDLSTLVAPTGPPVRCTQEVRPVEVLTSPSGATILDFGQNLVGRLRLRVSGPAGGTVRLRHAEVLQQGELYVRPLRGARATDEYVLGGGAGEEVWEPRFTFHGFRYAEVTGDVVPAEVTARVYHTDMRRTGTFRCSDPLIERLHENVVWSMRGNFLDVPTDCPQRDERLGWTGDIQVFTPTAAYLYDCAGMLGSWLRDLAAEQLPDGTVPFFVPLIPAPRWVPPHPAAVWGDAAVLVPWELYRHSGDTGVLHTQYDSAKAWVDCVTGRAGDDHLWETGNQLGDWLDPSAPADDPADAKADRHLVATAYYARSTAVLAEMAAVLGHTQDHRHYDALARDVARAFAHRWIRPSGLLHNDAQTSYALALRFGLVPEGEQRRAAGRRLAELVRDEDYRVTTGFAGTPVICDALAETGQLDTAYALLTQRECPSWLYPVTQGATTVWERWDSLMPDGTVNPGEMTSFNHYALGAVADWLHRTVAGLAPAEPGYRRLLVRPRPGAGLTHAAAAHETPYGRAAVEWHLDEDHVFVLDLEVPTGATATVDLPGRESFDAVSGTHRWRVGPERDDTL